MKDMVYIEAERDCYSPAEAAKKTMTVGELISLLDGYDENTPIILSHDNGYTYGWIKESRVLDGQFDETEY